MSWILHLFPALFVNVVSSSLVNVLNWNLRTNKRGYLSRDFYPLGFDHGTSWSSVRFSEKNNCIGLSGLNWLNNSSLVCFSLWNRSSKWNCKCWTKTLKTKIQIEIWHLPFLSQNKKEKTQYALKFWKCYSTFRI